MECVGCEPSRSVVIVSVQLTPVERYAVTFMENELAPLTTEELEKAEVCDVLPTVPWSKPQLSLHVVLLSL